MSDDERERLGRIAYEACCEDGRPRGFDAPDPCEPWEDLPPESRTHFAREAAAIADAVRRQERAKLAVLLEAAREMVEATDGHDADYLDWPLGWERFCAALAALEDEP